MFQYIKADKALSCVTRLKIAFLLVALAGSLTGTFMYLYFEFSPVTADQLLEAGVSNACVINKIQKFQSKGFKYVSKSDLSSFLDSCQKVPNKDIFMADSATTEKVAIRQIPGDAVIKSLPEVMPATKDELQKTAEESKCAKQILQGGRLKFLRANNIPFANDEEAKVWYQADMDDIKMFCLTQNVINSQQQAIAGFTGK